MYSFGETLFQDIKICHTGSGMFLQKCVVIYISLEDDLNGNLLKMKHANSKWMVPLVKDQSVPWRPANLSWT